MTTRRERHVSPEKNLTMAERMERVEQERAHIDSFDRDRQLQPGQLTPRARIAALVDDESFLEIGAFAKSQHRDAAAETPADGVITGYAEIGGRRVAVLAEDPVALANTDAQVGKNKRNRMISNAIYRRLPIVYLADGTPDESPEFDMHRGFLLSRVADQVPARDIAERDAPTDHDRIRTLRGSEWFAGRALRPADRNDPRTLRRARRLAGFGCGPRQRR